MSRVINPNSAGKERTALKKVIAYAVRALALSASSDCASQDIVAYIILGLDAISATIDRTVVAWEKRDYWLKADKFRTEWAWSESLSSAMRDALINEDWDRIILLSSQLAQHLSDVKISIRQKADCPWRGAYQKLMEGEVNLRVTNISP